MAESEGGSKHSLGHYLDLADHPLLLALAITLMVVPMMALASTLFASMGWTGPAGLFKHP